MRFGFGEVFLIFMIALFVVGPDRLPEYAKKFGSALRNFRDATGEATASIRETVIEPLNEAQQPLREALQPVADLEKDIQKEINDVNHSLNDLATMKPTVNPRSSQTPTMVTEPAAETPVESTVVVTAEQSSAEDKTNDAALTGTPNKPEEVSK